MKPFAYDPDREARIAAAPSERRSVGRPDGRGIVASPPRTPPDPLGRVRVAFLGPTLLSHGGTEVWHATLIPRLDPARIRVLGYGVVGGPPHAPSPAIEDARIVPLCPVVRGPEACRTLALEADVAVCWGLGGMQASLTRPRGPVVVHVIHGDGANPWMLRIAAEADGATDRLVAVSEAGRAVVPAGRPVAVIPNAVDPGRLEPRRSRAEVRAELGVPEAAPLLLYLGRLAREKRPALAVAGAAQVPGAWLALAGDGCERSACAAAAGSGSGRVIFLGVREDLGDLLGAADGLLSPSETEGFGLAVAEALWCGLPVIATPTGVLAGPDGPRLARLVPVAAGPEEWAAAIRADLADPEGRARRAEGARDHARRHYAPERFAEAWSDLLWSLRTPSTTELLANAERCPHRQPWPEGDRPPCGCPHRCTLGLGPKRRRGGVILTDCWECPQAPRLSAAP